MRVLLIDDDLNLASVTAGWLSDLGADVHAVATGPAAQDLLRTDRRFNLILMDWHLPGGGIALLDALAVLLVPAPPVVVVTADRSLVLLGIAHPIVSDLLAKPLGPAGAAALLASYRPAGTQR